MTDIELRDGGQLAGMSVAVLMESDYVEAEIDYYLRRFAEEGARTVLLTRLWGQDSLTFTGHEYQIPITVEGDLEAVDDDRLREFDALIVPAGMVSDRLRFTDDVNELPPAVKLLRRAFDKPELLKGIICHGMWLAAPIPEVVKGRRITCHNNLVSDVKNMGAIYTDQDVVVEGDLVTGRSFHECHLFSRMIIDLLAARNGRTPTQGPSPRTEAAVTAVSSPAPAAAPAAAQFNQVDFPFSDMIAGYVTAYDTDQRVIDLVTGDGRPYRVTLTDTTNAELARNLGDPYGDASGQLTELLIPGRHLFAHGVFYPEETSNAFEAQRLVFSGKADKYSFEQPDWWVRQLKELAAFYRQAEFGSAKRSDYGLYRTMLHLSGQKSDNGRQETDTISRLVYGMASAYMVTGDETFLEVAEQGTAYLRDHMRFVDRDEDVVYWYHGVDRHDGTERKVYASEFGDDYDAIAMYEQIYALAGPTQLYRLTGDSRIASDIDGTMRLFSKFFHDDEQGGYYSHIDPIQLSPHHESLGANQSRKNWNSVGDHAPAYLFNLYLATGDERHAAMLEDTFDQIAKHFPDTDDSPFVQERFHQDWSPDREWGWQQNRAVVGHNLKIAWNLTRMTAIRSKPRYTELAEHIARTMPAVGSDRQRGGWYDMVERSRAAGQQQNRFTWHDHKTWWQQEQAILAYLILAGHTGDAEFVKEARQAASFYNSFFLDHDEGGVFFAVLADGTPYLSGTERGKGSHSMSMYHTAELCYLATVYQRLLLHGEPLTLWFKPRPDGFPDRILRTAPDALPAGKVRLDWVEVDGKPYSAFDAAAMTVKLPDTTTAVTVRAHFVPIEN